VALLARVLDQLPRAGAGRARPCAHELSEHAARNLTHSAAASAGRARADRSVWLRAVSSTTRARNGDTERHGDLGPLRHLGQADLDLRGDVGAPATPPAPPSAAEEIVTEEGGEEIREVAKVERGGLEAAAPKTSVPEAVVELAPLGVGEDLVGLDDLAEPLIRVRLLRDIGMQLASKAPERTLDLVGARRSRHGEKLVVVALSRRHRLALA